MGQSIAAQAQPPDPLRAQLDGLLEEIAQATAELRGLGPLDAEQEAALAVLELSARQLARGLEELVRLLESGAQS